MSFCQSFSLPNGKRWTIKAFLEVSLASLTLEHELFFKAFEKKQVILLYWLAVQQQTSTFRWQKCDLFCLEFKAELNELSLNL